MNRTGWCVADAVIADLCPTAHGADTGVDGAFSAELSAIGGLAAVLLGMSCGRGGLLLLFSVTICGIELQG